MIEDAKEVSIVLNYDEVVQNIGLRQIAPDLMANLAFRAEKVIEESGLAGKPLTITATLRLEDAQCVMDSHGWPVGAIPKAARP